MLDAVLEFAHVAWPVITHEHVDGGRAQACDVLAVLEVHLRDKVVGQKQDVRLAVHEVGQIYLEYVQAVKEVFAEFSLLHEQFEVLTCARDDADVGVLADVRAQSHKGALLQKLQQFCLCRGRKVRHFVEEERAAFRLFRWGRRS